MGVLVVDLKDSKASELFPQSLRETGFAVITNHPISPDLINDVYSEWEDFFKKEEKFNYLYSNQKGYSDTPAGYFLFKSEGAKGYPVKDLKEFYQYYESYGLPEGFSNNTKILKDQLSDLAVTLLQWIEAATPEEIRNNFSMPLGDMVKDSAETLMRILYYPPTEGEDTDGSIRAAAHEDINPLTLLVAANEPGLQIQNNKGEWYEVPCEPGAIAVNAGDMLELITNRYFKSTTHRVVNPAGEGAKRARLSIPLFLHPHSYVRLSPNFTANEFLKLRLHALGLITDNDVDPNLLKFAA